MKNDLKDLHEVTRKDQAYKGFESAKIAGKMAAKMHLYLGLFFFFVQMFIAFILSVISYGRAWSAVFRYVYSAIVSLSWPDALSIGMKWLAWRSIGLFLVSSLIWLLYPSALRYFRKRAAKQSEPQYVRGAKLITIEELSREITKSGEQADLPLGEIRMPVSAEPKHGFIVGRPGVGKTVALSQIIGRLSERRAKGVIYDFKGDFVSKFYNPDRDILFNPLDTRCQGWTLFNELSNFMDVDAVAHSLIPPAYQADPFFNDAARDVFSGILHYLYQQGARSNADIWRAVTADKEDIAKWLSQTKGGERGHSYISDASSKQALGVIATMMQYTKAFEYMSKSDGDFSVKRWLDNPEPGFIFVTNYSDVKDTLKPILSLFIDLMGRKLLSMKDDHNRRVFFMLDEFGTLQRLSTIVQLLTLSRSKGGSVWIGIQDIGQIDKIYTPQLRQSIVNACGSNLIFSVADPDTAKFLSDKIGDTEYIDVEETQTMGPEENRDGISLVRRKRTEKLVLPSDIAGLPDLTAYLKIPNYHIAQTRFEYRSFTDRHEPFIMRPDLSLDAIMAEQAAIIAQAAAFTDGGKQQSGQVKADRNVEREEERDEGREAEDDLFFGSGS